MGLHRKAPLKQGFSFLQHCEQPVSQRVRRVRFGPRLAQDWYADHDTQLSKSKTLTRAGETGPAFVVSTPGNVDERQRRIGQNEALFRKVNERLNDLGDALSAFSGVLAIVCECGNLNCAEMLSITPHDYEQLRSEPTWFAVAPGHEVAAVETVVTRHDGYDIVEKRAGAPAEVAEETDPRS
jgi:hypothetical protein